MDKYKQTVKEVEQETKTDIEQGLTTGEAEKRSQQQGKINLMKHQKNRSQKNFCGVYLILQRSFYL